MIALAAGAVGLGAFLLFVIQPEVGKVLLPLLGGTPAVWNTCIVFFQFALLAGYLYAHAIARLALRTQVVLHLALMAIAAIALPLATPDAPSTLIAERPSLWLFAVLTSRVGAPYMIVAATAPLVQRWWASTTFASARDPYFLYAASNTGSLFALLAYPVLIEPSLTLGAQARAWTWGYAVLMLALGATGFAAWRQRQITDAAKATPNPAGVPGTASATAPGLVPVPADRVTIARRARWFVLSAVPVVVMLGVTTHITTDVAAAPLLWVLPLSVYLTTFILAFARRQIIPLRWASAFLPAAVLPPLLAVTFSATRPWLPLLGADLIGLFFAALVCHAELARDRPPTRYLTEFYLWMAAGGAVGGMLTTLVAPLVFKTVLEYPLGLLAACLLRPAPSPRTGVTGATRVTGATGVSRALLLTRADVVWIFVVALVAAASIWLQPRLPALPENLPAAILVLPALLIVITQWHRPWRFALSLAAALAIVISFLPSASRDLLIERSFFGVLRVRLAQSGDGPQAHDVHVLMNGTTLHGMQALDPRWRDDSVAYFGRTGPAGQILDARAHDQPPRRVGLVGLGNGSLLTFGRAEEHWTFFEINPAVIRVASDPRYFTYLSGAKARYTIVEGEGRLNLARQPDDVFDVLVLDAFSSDAIPAHLLTREAFALYFRKLRADGRLLVHISNRHLDLSIVLGAVARDLGLAALRQSHTPSDDDRDLLSSTWVLLARTPEALGAAAHDDRWSTLDAAPGARAWTDDYSSLLSVLKLHR